MPNKTPIKPSVLSEEIIADTAIFRIQSQKLKFSNGVERTYERLVPKGNHAGAVMIVAVNDQNQVMLIREYSAGTESYELSLPKGLVEHGETIFDAANRELKEEIGYGAENIEFLTEMTVSPGYMSYRLQVVVATGLYPERLEGDEPEPIEVVPTDFDLAIEYANGNEITEARAVAALYMTRELKLSREDSSDSGLF
ncbi:ADP compounds hydrolase NudE [Litoribrevibacter albus]|uniref:ADP compounds hydrolase NudE n=1 Tax=Litoribrevibacter albus TaxID=1473156 RepID=A0AA37SEF8_9GAMM|nr:ADP compounds hydrolase NudE [Litoribrevibacter albus]GLQ32539.1 ADP compounds hydrolase NudE [Litoribrevibacter albus]